MLWPEHYDVQNVKPFLSIFDLIKNLMNQNKFLQNIYNGYWNYCAQRRVERGAGGRG